MKYTNKCVDLIKEFEGYYTKLPDGGCKAYWDKYGKVWTIGYGCTEGINKDTVWTKAQAEKELRRELDEAQDGVDKLVTVPLTSNQNDALVSLVYNMGQGNLAKSSLLKSLNKKDYVKAGDSFTLYDKAKGVSLKGLRNRREKEQRLFRTYSKEELVSKSSKLSLLGSVRNFLKWSATAAAGLFTMDTFNVLSDVSSKLQTFVSNNALYLLIGTGLASWFIFKYIEYKSLKDHEEGRYIPSKE